MKRKILLSFSVLGVLLTCMVAVFSASSISKIRGSFTPNPSWTWGHPGVVLFDIGVTNSGYTATRDQDGYLTWFFWLGTVGWSTFWQCEDGGWVPLCNARILCPPDILQNPYQICPVYGYAWSQNAGWIVLSWSQIDTSYTGVYYNPSTTLIEGWWWNRWLGWIPFYAKTASEIATNATVTWVTMDGISVNFVWRIAIIWNIAGTRIFDLPDQNVGYVFSTTRHSILINLIRQNIAILTRNIADSILEDPFSPFDFLVEKSQDYVFDYARVWPVGKRSIIVEGHDVILDTTNTIWDPNDGVLRALIVLKDRDGNGGNIIISDKVRQIYAMLYAEGSIFSWEKTATWYIDTYLSHSAFNIPQKQLYIKGLLISKNTIGGARQSPIVCPVTTELCTQSTAELYDLNYFRTYDPSDPTQRAAPYSDPRLDTASMIIEYDEDILTDTPPWLNNTIQ